MTVIKWTCLTLLLSIFLLTCNRDSQESGPVYAPGPDTSSWQGVYHFAIHPLHNPTLLARAYQPLMDYLNATIPKARFQLEASRDYASFENKYRQKKPDILLPNPWQTLSAINMGYNVIAMAGEPDDFKGIFIVRKDSGINFPSDLLGKTVSYPAPTALAACIMPQFYLFNQGIDIKKDITNIYVGSQESSIMNVFIGESVAGATWPPPWRNFIKEHPYEASKLMVIWETPPLINNSIMVKSSMPSQMIKALNMALLNLHTTPRGQKILFGMETARFFDANNKTYDVVRKYIDSFEQSVRKVEM